MPTGYAKNGINIGQFTKGFIPWNKGKEFTEEHRKNLSLAHLGNEGYWLGKKRPEETIKKMIENRPKGLKCHITPHTEETKKRMSLVKIGKPLFRTEEGKKSFKEKVSGEKNWQWKGENVSYRSLHKWIERLLGKPHECENCGIKTLNHRQYHWSNISGLYKRIITDWRRLCVKCHKAVDKDRVKSELQFQY